MAEKPRNQEGQSPTRTPEETEERLREKERRMRGEADRVRTEERIDALQAEDER